MANTVISLTWLLTPPAPAHASQFGRNANGVES
jgi:hypothetical protein